jgi:hypothetical protein
LADPHSKLGHLVRREERKLAVEFPGADPLGLRREVAELRAVAMVQRSRYGLDAKVTLRKMTALERIVDTKLDRLRQFAAIAGRPLDLAKAIQQAQEAER